MVVERVQWESKIICLERANADTTLLALGLDGWEPVGFSAPPSGAYRVLIKRRVLEDPRELVE